ncbi:MAG: hypothetical protein JOZ77_11530 [Candidatus Eremiobacteraeota bacterium]|nr:hypothetical protein [Candidatus Eremiobacteraeota bacterium]
MKRLICVTVGSAVVVLAGCAAPAQLDMPVALERSSWMTTDAKTSDLLYVTDIGTNDVYVYSYPQGSLVGTLRNFNSPLRDCSDSHGNVYITNTYSYELLKYAHGAAKPEAALHDSNYLPWDCSVDPTTGNLAVTNYGPYSNSNTGDVVIYTDGKGSPKAYRDPSVQAYLYCSYDDSGNLFVDGLDFSYNFVLLKLPKGKSTFEQIALNQKFTSWGGVKWDGKDVAISDGTALYQYSVSGTKAKKIRVVSLKRSVNVLQFWIAGSTVIAPDGPNGAKHDAGFWKYPQGGPPAKTIGTGLFQNPSGATISVANGT